MILEGRKKKEVLRSLCFCDEYIYLFQSIRLLGRGEESLCTRHRARHWGEVDEALPWMTSHLKRKFCCKCL